MKLTMRSPIVYVAGAAALVALLVIARPVLNPAANPAEQSSNPSVAAARPLPAVPVVDLDLDRLRIAPVAQGVRDHRRKAVRLSAVGHSVSTALPTNWRAINRSATAGELSLLLPSVLRAGHATARFWFRLPTPAIRVGRAPSRRSNRSVVR